MIFFANKTFYNTIIFNNGVLNEKQKLKINNPEIQKLVDQWVNVPGMDLDKRFVYYLLGATGICVVPISSFCSDLKGFRVTLLEEDENLMKSTFTKLKDAIIEYLSS